ncbi:ribonuclease H family protein [Bacillus safensis]|uniref:ribonuclease H family protein n=1 Tax=Bacillus safensis TaxID=561879 RepID=UPI0020C0215F|nr:ribonuclease H family protein [Bacillus safensis]MCK8451706.1 ribonuclease H family protein [Bacillus safensis]MCY7568486.1 ribonuclease H family protein [Bacillus safensis]
MKLRAHYTMKVKSIGSIAFFQEDWMELKEALILAKHIDKKEPQSLLSFEDEKGAMWSIKELEKLNEELKLEPDQLQVYFDASFHKETGDSGLGVVVYYKLGEDAYRLRKNEPFKGVTNNEAEYAALFEAVKALKDLGASRNSVTIRGDSLVVMNQLKGEWPCYDDVHNKWLDRIEAALKELKLTPTYEVIDRKQNAEADQLARQMLADVPIESKLKLEADGAE